MEKEELEFINNDDDFKRTCLKKRKKACILAFLDGRTHKNALAKNFEQNIKNTEKIIDKYKGKPYAFGWVNATCHVNLFFIY